MAADLVHFEVEVVGGLSDGAAGLEEGLGDLAAGGGPVGLMCDDEDEDGVSHSGEGAADAAADLSWVLVSEACDLCGGLSVSVHGENEWFVVAFEVLGAGDDGVCESGIMLSSEVDSIGDLVEPVCLVDL